ncbi:MAG: response regulator [Elusimicrobiaceae bacterium]|nr:response regulator [Elusimicrobiaceae bacterium]
MKKLILLALCLITALSANAQKFKIKKPAHLYTPKQVHYKLNSATHMRRLARLQRIKHPTSSIIFRATPHTTPVFINQTNLSIPQRNALLKDYDKALSQFEDFKAKQGPFIYYQSIPTEARDLHPFEQTQLTNQLIDLQQKLWKVYKTTPQDKALIHALEFVNHGIEIINPALEHVAAAFHPSALNVKKATPEDFFLYPSLSNKPNPLEELVGKKIAIINDDVLLLASFERQSQMGVLFPHAELYTEALVAQFLLGVPYSRFDIVFTDINLADGNGYMIARTLRDNGYKGGIIALTSYPETSQQATQLQGAGFDGMISLDPRYLNKMPLPQRLTYAAQEYLKRAQKLQ